MSLGKKIIPHGIFSNGTVFDAFGHQKACFVEPVRHHPQYYLPPRIREHRDVHIQYR